ncbi:S8 family serine peptidase [Candidatus Woesearchaeota archaeon]|nr:S8 family serine peptidase [Candidatus Woesearchaeota archaeon]
MKRTVVIVFLFFLLVLSISLESSASKFSAGDSTNADNNANSNGKIDKEVEELLKYGEEVSVIVVLEDDYDALDGNLPSALTKSKKEGMNKNELDEKKNMVVKQQEKVLSGLDLKEEKNKRRKINFLEDLDSKNFDFELKRKFDIVNGFSGKITKRGIEKLKQNANVKKIYPNRPVYAFLSNTTNIVNASRAWSLIYNGTNLTGKGESICVIDTGVDYTHSNLGNCASTANINDGACAKVIAGYDFVNDDSNPIDDHGHGTHVAGIIASTNDTYRGIAPDANIVAIKSLNAAGSGSTQTIVDGINWCVNNASIFNITVISMSLGGSTLYTGYCDDSDAATAAAIDAAIAKNISVIVSTGKNGDTSGISTPSCIRNSTAVGSTTKANAISSFSNRNNLTDLLAPGTSITSLKNNGGTQTLSGTSMAAPHVAAAFALIHQYFKLTQNKTVMPNETQRYLNNTGKQIDDSSGSGLTFSRINIFAAIASLDTSAPKIEIITPENNSVKTNLSFIINITSSEVLANATLEINNTNFTMAGSAIQWNANISSLANGTYTYKIYGNDTFGNSNISSVFTVSIDLIAPYWSNNLTNISNINNIIKGSLLQFNITWNDTVSLSGYIFSWNSTGAWDNVTNGSMSGKTQNVSINKTISLGRGNVIAYKFYANDSANNFNETEIWAFSVSNTIPTAFNASINLTDTLNRTNGTLQAFFSFADTDDDAWLANETLWYNNTEEVSKLRNLTIIGKGNTTKGQNWTFSVRVYDGFNWSEWSNSTNLTIKNAMPQINVTIDNITVNETQKVNITVNASDIDNDALTFGINDSRFSLSGIYFIWNTNLSDSGSYTVNITVNDTQSVDFKVISIEVLDASDLDNDGNPDFNDIDDDNDNIADDDDYLLGNYSVINTTLTVNVTVNGTSNLSKIFNGTFFVNITNGSAAIVEFNFTFNFSSRLDLSSILLNKTNNGSSALSIRNINLTALNKTKTAYIDKVNSTAKAVCIKDKDVGFDNISSACNSADELLVLCNNQSNNAYTCYDTGTIYRITGLNHSAMKELCADNDGDGYGNGCALGSDCNDNDRSKTTDCSSDDSGSGGSGSGSSGNSGSGGGGSPIITEPSKSNKKVHFYSAIKSGQQININVNRENVAFKKVEFTANKDLESVTISINAINEDDAISISDNVYAFQYIEVEADGMSSKDVSNVKIQFEVNNSWIADNKLNADTVALNRYSSGWQKLATNMLAKGSKISYSAYSPGFSIFAITAEKPREIINEPVKSLLNLNENKAEEKSKENPATATATAAVTAEIRGNKPAFFAKVSVAALIMLAGIIYVFGFMKKRRKK